MADHSTETLQARREWQGIFKVLKEKTKQNKTKITLPSKNLIQNSLRNQKLYRQAKVKRIEHHQISFKTNVKGTYIGRKHKRSKRPTKNKPKTIKKMPVVTYINN